VHRQVVATSGAADGLGGGGVVDRVGLLLVLSHVGMDPGDSVVRLVGDDSRQVAARSAVTGVVSPSGRVLSDRLKSGPGPDGRPTPGHASPLPLTRASLRRATAFWDQLGVQRERG